MIAVGDSRLSLFRRLRLASGEPNFEDKNDNELVNPGETLWKWRKVGDFVKETYSK